MSRQPASRAQRCPNYPRHPNFFQYQNCSPSSSGSSITGPQASSFSTSSYLVPVLSGSLLVHLSAGSSPLVPVRYPRCGTDSVSSLTDILAPPICWFSYEITLAEILFIFLIYFNWRLITLQYCSEFCHTLTWISHGCTCVPHPEPPSPSHPSGSSQCTSPEHPVSCIEPGLAIYFTYGNINIPMLFSQIIPPSPSPTESKSLFFTSVSLLMSHI